MNKIFIIITLFFLTACPSFSYSNCYRAPNNHVICTEYVNNYGIYNRYNYPAKRRNYYSPYMGETTTVKYQAGTPVTIRRGFGPERNINSNNNIYTNSGAAFVFK